MARKLLLADDSITVQRVIELTFADEGLDIVTVGDGAQAIERLTQQDPPDIVLADLNMPGADGYAVAEHIKRGSATLAATTRVVLLTGAFEPVDPQRARQLGVDGILEKPFEPQIAIELVRRLLEQEPLAAPRIEKPATSGGSDWTAGVMTTSVTRHEEDRPPVAAGYPFEPGAAAARSTPAELDDYFKRLDEALTNAGLRASPAVQDMLAESREIMGAVTHVDAAQGDPGMSSMNTSTPGSLRGTQADAGTFASAAQGDRGASAPPPVTLVDAFSALLAGELGETPAAPPVRVPVEAPAVALHVVTPEVAEPQPPRMHIVESRTQESARESLVDSRDVQSSSVEAVEVVDAVEMAATDVVETDRAHVIGFRGAEAAVAESSVAEFQEAEEAKPAFAAAMADTSSADASASTAFALASESAVSEAAASEAAASEVVASSEVASADVTVSEVPAADVVTAETASERPMGGVAGFASAGAGSGFGLARAFTPVTEPVTSEPAAREPEIVEAKTDAPAVDAAPAPAEPAAPALAAVPAAQQPIIVKVSEEMVEAVVRRVLAEMSDKVVREIVSTQVLDVAERLVREEIERLKADAERSA